MDKRRRERFPTAVEMRRELLAFIRTWTDDDSGETLGRLMRGLFEDRVAEKTEMLTRVRQGSQVDALPAAEVDIQVELSTVEDKPTSVTPASVTLPRGRGGPRRRWMPIVGVIGALSIGTLVMGLRGSRDASSDERPPPLPAQVLSPIRADPRPSTAPADPSTPSANADAATPLEATPLVAVPAARPQRPSPPSSPRRRTRPAPAASTVAAKPSPSIW
jgi:hypothetical protein